MAYTKLFADLVASSIWDEDNVTRIVWVTMLALKDRDHYVRGTEVYLAAASRVTLEECQRALGKLRGPDPKSRNQREEGRRIRDEPGGWTVINGDYYQNKLSWKERKEYNRVKQAEYRKRKKQVQHDGACDGARQVINEGFGGVRQ